MSSRNEQYLSGSAFKRLNLSSRSGNLPKNFDLVARTATVSNSTPDAGKPHAPLSSAALPPLGTHDLEKKPDHIESSSTLQDLILGSHPSQRFNIKVSFTGLMSYVACVLLVLYCGQVGLIDRNLIEPIVAGMVLTIVGIYAALRSGWSERFRDPSLSLVQRLAAVTWSTVGYAITHEAHGGLLMMVIVTANYGVFSLRGPSIRILQSYSLLLVGATMVWMVYSKPAIYSPIVELACFGSLTVSLLMLSWLVGQLADLRNRERDQRNELTATLLRIEECATHDVLTGLYNRRHMNTLLAHHMARADRAGEPLTLALLDLDHFKRVNDTYGHAVGDEVLKAFSEVTQSVLNGNAILARWGGEEFLLLSTTLSADGLRLAIDRVRVQFAQRAVSTNIPTLRANFSAGVASHSSKESLAALMERTDQALYAAKEAGRGRTHISYVEQANANSADVCYSAGTQA